MHCTASQKVAGLIPDGVTGIFLWHDPSGRTMALGLTQPLTEMNTARYRTWNFFNNSIFEQEYVCCVRNEEECVCSAPDCCDTEQRSASQPACC